MPAPYALPELIQARLEAAGIIDPVSGNAVPVLHVADLAGVREEAQIAPAFQVIPYRIGPNDDGAGGNLILRESALVLAVVRVPNRRDAQQERLRAGEMLRLAALRLMGWQPSADYSELIAESAPPAEHTPSFGYYPLLFSTTFEVS
jgi:hypothetical protein